MDEHPIIFSGEMIRAILEGRKTQTRRIAKLTDAGHVKEPRGHRRWHPDDPEAYLACPYGQPGYLLWVRETFAKIYKQDGCLYEENFGDKSPECKDCGGCTIEYRADTTAKFPGEWPEDFWDDPECPKWSSPYHMFRWQSRILLEISSIRIERLQEISEVDAKAEGVEPHAPSVIDGRIYRRPFEILWDSINAKRGFPWSSNPFVWVVEFARKNDKPQTAD